MSQHATVDRKASPTGRGGGEHGSALLMTVFVLILLTGMGTALLFLSQQETKMGKASLDVKRAFYLAEAAIEDGRTTLFQINGTGPFDDDLTNYSGDGTIDLDFSALQAVYDADGNVTGFSGYGNDVPLRSLTQLDGPDGTGWYAAFLSNDPVDPFNSLTDTNERVMVTGVGAGPDRSFEVVQAIIEPFQLLPDVPSAALTLLGSNPHYDNGTSNAQDHDGNDCGVAGGPFAPIVGTIDAAARTTVQNDMNRPEQFDSGPWTEEDTIADLTDPTDPIVADAGHGTIELTWTDCQALKDTVALMAVAADYYCNSDFGACSLPAGGPDQVVFVDGDLSGTPNGTYTGILVVTGTLDYSGNTAWEGIILAIGEGKIIRDGGGNGTPSGSVVVANIDPTPSGPAADHSDWCTTPPNGFGQAWYDTSGGGNSEVQWCSGHVNQANDVRSYRVTEFLQR